MDLYTFCMFFMIYAFLGWCTEVLYAAFNSGRFVNRGFLNGPICPVYGFGVVLVTWILRPVEDQIVWLFLGSVIVTSVLEFITGYVLERFFHDKWWDYSGEPFNIKGYICPKFSILWGLACVIIVDRIHPLIQRFVQGIPYRGGIVVLLILYAILFADLISTVMTIVHWRKRLRLMDEIAMEIRKFSDHLGSDLSSGIVNAQERKTEFLNKRMELQKKYTALREQHSFGTERLRKAYPNLFNKLKKKYDEIGGHDESVR